MEKIEARENNTSSLSLTKQQTSNQEAKTKGMLRMMDSNASLTKLETVNGNSEGVNSINPSGVVSVAK